VILSVAAMVINDGVEELLQPHQPHKSKGFQRAGNTVDAYVNTGLRSRDRYRRCAPDRGDFHHILSPGNRLLQQTGRSEALKGSMT
jgi:hypothetical protein